MASTRFVCIGPMATTVAVPDWTSVRPASRTMKLLTPSDRAFSASPRSSLSLEAFSTTLVCPVLSQRFKISRSAEENSWIAPTAAWPHCAAIFPLVICRSLRTTKASLVLGIYKSEVRTTIFYWKKLETLHSKNMYFSLGIHCRTVYHPGTFNSIKKNLKKNEKKEEKKHQKREEKKESGRIFYSQDSEWCWPQQH